MIEKTTDREGLWRELFKAPDMPFPPYITRGVVRLDEVQAASFLATLTDIRRLPERAE